MEGLIVNQCANRACRAVVTHDDDGILLITSAHVRRFCDMDCVVQGYEEHQKHLHEQGDLSAKIAVLEAQVIALKAENNRLRGPIRSPVPGTGGRPDKVDHP